MMRVLLVIRGAASRDDRVSHRRLPHVLEHVRRDGVEVTVALANDPGGLRHELAAVAPVHVLPVDLPPRPRSLPALPWAVGALRPLTRTFRPDVIEGHEPIPALAAGIAGQGASAITIYRRHHQSGPARLRWTSRLAAAMADYTVVSSDALVAEVSRDDHPPPSRILIVASGMPDISGDVSRTAGAPTATGDSG